MDDEALSQLVDQAMGAIGGAPGTFHADGGFSKPGKQDDVGKQVLMASLRRGYFSTEPVAVGVDGKIDVEYGNRGPEIDPLQQSTNSGYLSAKADCSKSDKQARYEFLCMFGHISGPLGEELQALKDDEDVHSVSVISGGQDTNTDNFSPCAIDCWLKRRCIECAALRDPRPSLDARRWKTSVQLGGGERGDIYTPLAANHTRILRLEPGSYGDEITCSLITHPCTTVSTKDPVAELTAYEALSYAWGDPTPRFVVQCNGQTLPVAHNLFLALQHLRHPTAHRLLWIDAICINQNDLDERSTQIQHMLNIYHGATRILIWLGEESETSPLAIDAMKALDQPSERKGVVFRIHERRCYELLKAICDAFGELLERPWFVRSWIRQELSVAKDAVVLCGRDSLSWYTLKRSAARLGHLRRKLSKESGIEILGPESTRHGLAISYLTRGWIYGQSVTKIMGCIRSIWYYHAGGLLELLMTGRHFDSTDPRDKVYAVLGLGRVPMKTGKRITEEQEGSLDVASFPVDYSKSVSEVYQDTVKYFINRDRNLDILTLLLTTRNTRSATDLPSWVPDWRVPASEIPITSHWDFISMKFAASGLHSKAELQCHSEKGILRCKGFLIDRIETQLDYTAQIASMLSLLPDFGDYDSPPRSEEAEIGERKRQRALAVQQFDPSTHRTRCFETMLPLVCLAPAEARAGDEIAVLYGGKHPFVVRHRGRARMSVHAHSPDASPCQGAKERSAGWIEVEEREEARSKLADNDKPGYSLLYEVVGPCIIPEVMFGRVAKVSEEQGEAVEEFVLV